MALNVERFVPPTGGADYGRAPLVMGKDKARHVENFLVDQPGKLPIRGPLGDFHDIYSSGTNVKGVWTHTDGTRVPRVLFQGATTSDTYRYSLDTETSVNVSLTTVEKILSGRSVQLGPLSYGCPYTHGSTSTSSRILSYTGLSSEPGQFTTAPRYARAIAVHQERLIVAGGLPPGDTGTSATKLNSLYWSDLGGPGTDTTAAWSDDVSGLINEIVVGDDPADRIIALASLGRQLIVFKFNSIWAIRGDGPSTWTASRIADNTGILGSDGTRGSSAFVVTDDKVIFMSPQGPMMYDGVEFTRITGLEREWLNNVTGTITITRLYNNYVAFTGLDRVWLLYLPTMSWTALSAPSGVLALTTANYWVLTAGLGVPHLFDGLGVRKLDEVTSPFGDGTELDTGGNSAQIEPTVKYRLASLAAPTSRAVTRRIVVDHYLGAISGGQTPNWYVTLRDGKGDAVGSTVVVPGRQDAEAPTTIIRMTDVAEILGREFSDLTLDVEYIPTGVAVTPTLYAGELHDIWVEYVPAQQSETRF